MRHTNGRRAPGERPIVLLHSALLLQQLVEGADKGPGASQHHQPFCAVVEPVCC